MWFICLSVIGSIVIIGLAFGCSMCRIAAISDQQEARARETAIRENHCERIETAG